MRADLKLNAPAATEPQPQVYRRKDAARHLISRPQLAASLRMNDPGVLSQLLWIVGLQAALATSIVLPLVYLSPFAQLIGFAGLGTLLVVFGGSRSRGDRSRIILMATLVQGVSVFIFSLVAWMQLSVWIGLGVLTLAIGLYTWICMGLRFGPPGPLLFIFAAAASLGEGQVSIAFEIVLMRTAATIAAALAALAIIGLLERQRLHWLERKPAAPPSAMPRPTLRRTVIWTGASAGVAMFVAEALGLSYPAWAGMGAVVVAQNRLLHVAAARMVERVAGGVVGALLAGAILWLQPSAPVVIAILVLSMVMAEGLIWRNYGLGQIFVTMMALLMIYLAGSGAVDSWMPVVRILDTLIGVTIGMAVTLMMSTTSERLHLADLHRNRTRRG